MYHSSKFLPLYGKCSVSIYFRRYKYYHVFQSAFSLVGKSIVSEQIVCVNSVCKFESLMFREVRKVPIA